jgi:hypothetical protein
MIIYQYAPEIWYLHGHGICMVFASSESSSGVIQSEAVNEAA